MAVTTGKHMRPCSTRCLGNADHLLIFAGEKPSYVFLGCTTEMPGWETKPYAALERANAGSYSMVQANAAQSNATYFLISRGATENYEGSSAYWFRQDKPAPLKLAAGNFQACHTPCAAGDKSKMCGSAEDDGARLWAVYGTPGRSMLGGSQVACAIVLSCS